MLLNAQPRQTTAQTENAVIFAVQSSRHGMPCSGTCIRTALAERGANSGHLLPAKPPAPISHLPCTCSWPYNQWTEWYLNTQVWLCFHPLRAVPGKPRRSPSCCGGGRALGMVPSCREPAGAITFYISMIFLSATAANNEAGSGGDRGCQQIRLLRQDGGLNKNPSMASEPSLPFVA